MRRAAYPSGAGDEGRGAGDEGRGTRKGAKVTTKREARQVRLAESATAPWLSESMQASLMSDYADAGLPSPVTAVPQ